MAEEDPLIELETAFDVLVEELAAPERAADAAAARAEHGERTGRVFEDDRELYEARTRAFLEWYTVERPGPDGQTLARAALRAHPESPHAPAWRAWSLSHRSLFQVVLLGEGVVNLADLLGGARFAVVERRRVPGVAAGDLVEARLLSWHGQVRFGRAFCYHPRGTLGAVRAHLDRLRAAGRPRLEAVDFIASLRVKAERYKHLAPEKVYASERL